MCIPVNSRGKLFCCLFPNKIVFSNQRNFSQNTPKNNNRLTTLIRDISEKRNIPRLTGSEPLEILLEIGLQKVSKDYEYIFTESKICSLGGYQAFIKYVIHAIV